MPSNTSQSVAAELRAIIARRGVSSRTIAADLGVTPMWLSRRLRGHVPISVGDLARICAALEIRPADVYAATEGEVPA